jgi:hypothetical protein
MVLPSQLIQPPRATHPRCPQAGLPDDSVPSQTLFTRAVLSGGDDQPISHCGNQDLSSGQGFTLTYGLPVSEPRGKSPRHVWWRRDTTCRS